MPLTAEVSVAEVSIAEVSERGERRRERRDLTVLNVGFDLDLVHGVDGGGGGGTGSGHDFLLRRAEEGTAERAQGDACTWAGMEWV